jgi:hypothetical protein
MKQKPSVNWREILTRNNNSNFIAAIICFSLYFYIDTQLIAYIKYSSFSGILLFLSVVFLIAGVLGVYLKQTSKK